MITRLAGTALKAPGALQASAITLVSALASLEALKSFGDPRKEINGINRSLGCHGTLGRAAP